MSNSTIQCIHGAFCSIIYPWRHPNFMTFPDLFLPSIAHHAPWKISKILKFIHYWYRVCKSTPRIQVKPYWIDYWNLCYFNDLFDQFECTFEVLTVPTCRWRPVMRRPVMLTDLIKKNTILSYDRSWSPDKLINLINQIDQFECTYKVLFWCAGGAPSCGALLCRPFQLNRILFFHTIVHGRPINWSIW